MTHCLTHRQAPPLAGGRCIYCSALDAVDISLRNVRLVVSPSPLPPLARPCSDQGTCLEKPPQ